jgi:DNA (cytosine-5)-methyltransferase 1
MKLCALDLFCGAGGATRGLQLAGFHVTGIDSKPQPRYIGDAFIQADALNSPVDLRRFDFIWASPPCQAFTALRHLQTTMHGPKDYPNLIPQTRELLNRAGVPFANRERGRRTAG